MIKQIFLISDLLFPIWWIILMIFFIKKGLSSWKAWGIASTFCVMQAYLVAKFIGWNLGGYLMFYIASLPNVILGEVVKKETSQSQVLFWLLPPVILIFIPMLILFFISKSKKQ